MTFRQSLTLFQFHMLHLTWNVKRHHMSVYLYCNQLLEVRKVRRGRQHIADACLVSAGEQHSLFRPLTG